MKPWKKAACGLVALGTVASFAAPAGAATDVPFTNDETSRIQIAGSDTTYLVMQNLGKAYMETEGCALNGVSILPTGGPPATIPVQNRCQGATTPEGLGQPAAVKTENYDHDVILNYFPQGSSAGLRQLCAQLNVTDPARLVGLQYIDIARTSSAPASGFQCVGTTGAPASVVGTRVLRYVAFAKDALTWVYWDTATGGSRNGANVVNNLTVQNLKDIYVNCTITNWNQVGGSNKPIIAWTAIAASGSRATWDGFVGGNSTTCIPAAFKDGTLANGERVIREHFAQPVEVATNDPAAADEGDSIYPFSVGLHNTQPALAQSSLLGNVNSIVPSEANIVDGSFPFTRLLYNAFINAGPQPVASEAVRRFTNMRNWTGPSQNEQLGWICKPLNSHAKPSEGDPGVGIPTPGASFNYASVVDSALRSTGFYPLTTDITQPRCTFTDWRVDAGPTMTQI